MTSAASFGSPLAPRNLQIAEFDSPSPELGKTAWRRRVATSSLRWIGWNRAVGAARSSPQSATESSTGVGAHSFRGAKGDTRTAKAAAGIGLVAGILLAMMAAEPVRAAPPRPVINEAKVAAAGIRKLRGKHVDIYTDLRSTPAVDQLPKVFDLAVPQWCAYFQVEPANLADWRVVVYLIDRKERFQGSGLFPGDLPPFLHGFQRGWEIWVYDQPSDYYRRHLLLHEGTHGFMNFWFNSCGPPWYMEGLAEFLGTHRWEGGKLTLGYFPRDKRETPEWGRIKIIKDEIAAGRGMLLPKVFQYDSRAHLRNEPYAWCWAAAAFLDSDPRTRRVFRSLPRNVQSPDFTAKFLESLRADWPEIAQQWQLFILNLDYGYDLKRAAIEHKPGRPVAAGGVQVAIQADRGWQSTGVKIEANRSYTISARGRFQLADKPKVWWCEANGVTIRYHRGNPAGMLMAAVTDPRQAGGLTPLARPVAVGTRRKVSFSQAGVLYLRINESAADLHDNRGQLQVRIEAD